LFTWTGRVDQEIQLVMNGRSLTTSNMGPREPGQRLATVSSALPRESGEITVDLVGGRGTADVIRQPTAANGYTAIIRIRDPQPGAGDYRLRALWESTANGEVGPPFGRDDDRGSEVRGGRLALSWQGDVDDNLEIRVSPNGTSYRTMSGKDPRGVQSSFVGLPAGVTRVEVQQTSGRGQVYVVQQPTAENGYVALLRVTDPRSGFDHYGFTVTWR
jgi:hypothetical protein